MFIKLIDLNGVFLGTLKIEDAIKEAKKRNLDLINVNNNTNPKIYRLGNYKKYLFDKKKNIKKIKNIKKKEIKIKTSICEYDYKTKIKKIHNFLNKKFIVKIFIIFFNKKNNNNKKFFKKLDDDISKKFNFNKNIIFNEKNIIINILNSVKKN
ncbi:translation initiation factor IF-3 [Candidatus Vidania fulgoroideorum]